MTSAVLSEVTFAVCGWTWFNWEKPWSPFIASVNDPQTADQKGSPSFVFKRREY